MILGHKKIYNSLSFCNGELSGLNAGESKVFYFPHLIGLQSNDKDIVLSDGQYYYEPIVNSLNGEHQLGFFKRLWKGIKRTVRKVGKFVGRVAKKVVKGVKKVGKAVWKGVKKVGKFYYNTYKKIGGFVVKKVLPVVKKVVKVVAPILSFVPGPIGLIATGVDLLWSLVPDPKNPGKKIPVKRTVTRMVKGRKVASTGRKAKISQLINKKRQLPTPNSVNQSVLISQNQKQAQETIVYQQLLQAQKQLEVLDKNVSQVAKKKSMSTTDLLSIVKSAQKQGIDELSVIKNIKAYQMSADEVQKVSDLNAKANAMKALSKGMYKEDFHKLSKLEASIASQNTAQKKDTELIAQLTAQKHNAGKVEQSELERLVRLESKAKGGLTTKQISDLSKKENRINAATIATQSDIEKTTKNVLELAKYQALISAHKKQTNSKTNNNLLMYGAIGLITLIASSNS